MEYDSVLVVGVPIDGGLVSVRGDDGVVDSEGHVVVGVCNDTCYEVESCITDGDPGVLVGIIGIHRDHYDEFVHTLHGLDLLEDGDHGIDDTLIDTEEGADYVHH